MNLNKLSDTPPSYPRDDMQAHTNDVPTAAELVYQEAEQAVEEHGKRGKAANNRKTAASCTPVFVNWGQHSWN